MAFNVSGIPPLLGLMAVYNEIDILEENLQYHRQQGVAFLILDNGSTDGSFELARSFPRDVVLAVRRVESQSYRWAHLLELLMAWSEDVPSQWKALIDADTFLEAPWPELALLEGINRADREGFNVIKFDNFEFWPVQDVPISGSVQESLRHYSWSDDKQEKCWRSTPGVRNHRSGGHILDFPTGISKRVFPENFVMRHYPIRSVDHGLRKVFEDRIPRFAGEPPGWHIQYADFERERSSFLRRESELVKRVEGEPWCRERRLECRSAPRAGNRGLRSYR